jgi:hypothetical protein
VHCYANPGVDVFVHDKSVAMRLDAPGVPLWCTEWGSNFSDEATQAQQIGAVLDDNDRNNRFERMYLFQLDDDGQGYHIVRSDGSWRQAALLFPDRAAP